MEESVCNMQFNIKKKDWILIGIIVAIALLSFLMHQLLQDAGSGKVVVKVDGAIEGVFDLGDDQKITINDSNIVVINNGKATMVEADCPDQLCVKQKAISKNHESIICLPNKVVVEIVSQTESTMDAVTN